MRNEFEKQVQQKMEELDFVPSPPVWEKVEAQILQKKDRRRMFIWLPLLCLLLIMGTWWLNNADEDKNSSTLIDSPVTKEINDGENKKGNATSNVHTPPVKPTTSSTDNLINQQRRGVSGKKDQSSVRLKITVPGKTFRSKIQGSHSMDKSRKRDYAIRGKSYINIQGEMMDSAYPIQKKKENISGKYTSFIPLTKADTNQFKNHKNGLIQRLVIPGVVQDSNIVLVNQPTLIKKLRTKWKFGATAALGISQVDQGFNFFGGNKSFDAVAPMRANFVTPLLYNNTDVSDVEGKNISFSTGAVARKQIDKKLIFSTGLGYHYFSKTTFVGVAINPANAVQSSTLYYINYGIQKQEYHNQYHFISLPVGLDMRVLQNVPLHLYAGMSIKHLITTNALQFNNQSQAYYYNKQGIKKTQWFSSLGLNYAFLKGQSLIIGPQIEYGLSKLDHATSPQHLYAYVLKAQWIFINK